MTEQTQKPTPASRLLVLLANNLGSTSPQRGVNGPTLQGVSGLSPIDINKAINELEASGAVEGRHYIGTTPFSFGRIWLTPRGKYEAERITLGSMRESKQQLDAGLQSSQVNAQLTLPPAPIGSPYGFNEADWRAIAQVRSLPDRLIVVLGLQFKSAHYDTVKLERNIARTFQYAVDAYNASAISLPAKLDFRPLVAGYGEHLFNEIARDIISADIAVFETSDLNPNVMLELGVALTWGVRVLPIKLHSQPKPPSDISGHTWADFEDSAFRFTDPDHDTKLLRMVERAMHKKASQ